MFLLAIRKLNSFFNKWNYMYSVMKYCYKYSTIERKDGGLSPTNTITVSSFMRKHDNDCHVHRGSTLIQVLQVLVVLE
jgi:hypothetical protein